MNTLFWCVHSFNSSSYQTKWNIYIHTNVTNVNLWHFVRTSVLIIITASSLLNTPISITHTPTHSLPLPAIISIFPLSLFMDLARTQIVTDVCAWKSVGTLNLLTYQCTVVVGSHK